MKHSPSFARHMTLATRFFDFAGYEMPEYYTSMEEETTACRERVILFDGHAMGEVHLVGNDALAAMQSCASPTFPGYGRGAAPIPACAWRTAAYSTTLLPSASRRTIT